MRSLVFGLRSAILGRLESQDNIFGEKDRGCLESLQALLYLQTKVGFQRFCTGSWSLVLGL